MADKNTVRSFSSNDDHSRDDMFHELQECADILVEKLQGDDIAGVVDVVQALVDARDRSLFKEVGRLTRGLHEALTGFHIDADLSEKDANGVPLVLNDASHRLDYVINLMQEAADKTLDRLDEISPVATQFSQEAKKIKEEWEKLRRKEMNPDEFRKLYVRMDNFLIAAVTSSDQLNEQLQRIMLTQSYQDISGQIIRRVINMVKEVESNLVDLVRRSGQIEKLVGIVTAEQKVDENICLARLNTGEGPQTRKRDDVAATQDEVDNILSSLGF